MIRMKRENWLLVIDEPVEVQDFMKIVDHLERNLLNIPQINKENQKMSMCNRLDLGTL